MLFSMFVAFGMLTVLIVDTIITGWPAISWQLLSGVPSTFRRRQALAPRSWQRSTSA